MKIFSKYRIKFFDDFDLYVKDLENEESISVFFLNKENFNLFESIKKKSFPMILINNDLASESSQPLDLKENLDLAFSINEFEKKIISLIAKNQFKKKIILLYV